MSRKKVGKYIQLSGEKISPS